MVLDRFGQGSRVDFGATDGVGARASNTIQSEGDATIFHIFDKYFSFEPASPPNYVTIELDV